MSVRFPFLILALSLLACLPASSADYTGPRPELPDTPYLVHASKLVALDVGEAKEESRKEGMFGSISGSSAKARTPMAEPIFIMETKAISADKLELYKFEVKNGNREVFLQSAGKKSKQGAKPMRLTVTRLGPNLYRIEAAETLEPGEYSLSPSDSNKVFCFQVY